MTSHFKKYTMFLLCTALLNAAFFFPAELIAEQTIPVHDAHETVESIENHEQLTEIQKNDTQAKKPTILESWRKVVTLRWKELGKTDAWNIGAPVASIATLGLFAYSYWPKQIIADNTNHNPNDNNPGGGTPIPHIIPTNNHDLIPDSSDSDSSSDDDAGDSTIIPPIIPTNNHVSHNTNVLNPANRLDSDLTTTVHQPVLSNTNSSSSDSSDSSSSSDDADSSSSDSSRDGDLDANVRIISLNDLNNNTILLDMLVNAMVNNLPIPFRVFDPDASNSDSSNDNDGNNEAMLWALNFATNNLDPDPSDSDSSRDDGSSSIDTTSSSDSNSSSSSLNASSSDSSGEAGADDRENHALIPLTPEQRKNIACLCDNEVLIGDIQHKIALDMITDFLLLPKKILRDTGIISSIVISANEVVTISATTAKIWNINDDQLPRKYDSEHFRRWQITTSENTRVTGEWDTITKIWKIYNHEWNIITATNNDKIMVTISDDTAKIWPLFINLNAPEFTDPEHALFWIKHNLLPMQANLIARAHTATQAEETFEINSNTDDAHIWITFPEHVREYLYERLNIQLFSKQECSICLDVKNSTEFHIMNGCNGSSGCKSSFCRECLLGQITAHLDEGSTLELTCPNVQCGKKMNQSDVRTITQNNKDLYNRFDQITLKEYMTENPQIKHCQTPDCTFSFILEDDVERQKIRCKCRRKYCSHCLFNHSFKITCDQAKEDRELAQNPELAQQATAKWLAENTKPCPNCNTSIQKNKGCNHMTCKKCKHEFCWTCSARWGTTECGIDGCAVLDIETGTNF